MFPRVLVLLLSLLTSLRLNAAIDDWIFWRHHGSQSAQGLDYLWIMNGATLTNALPLSQVSLDWVVVGEADMNGDGVYDYVWQNVQTALIYVWTMNANGTLANAQPVDIAGTWTLVAVSDLDGDGRGDLFLQQNSQNGLTRRNVIMFMNGNVAVGSVEMPETSQSLHVQGVADLDNDGINDIVLVDQNRNLSGWLQRAGQITQSGPIGSYPSGWHIDAFGDADGDGKADFIWRNESINAMYFWKLDGLTVVNQQVMQNVDASWGIFAAGDFNHDGKLDLLWWHISGATYIWFLDGPNTSFQGPMPTVSDTNWRMVAPRPLVRP